MAAKQGFFEKDSPHGLVKRMMYKKYLQAFIRITQKWEFKTIIIDGFAGAGSYDELLPKEIEKYGSPLIALMVSLNFFHKRKSGEDKKWDLETGFFRISNRPIIKEEYNCPAVREHEKVSLIFVEKDADNFESLWNNITLLLSYFFDGVECFHVKQYLNCLSIEISGSDFPVGCRMYKSAFETFIPPESEFDHIWLTFVDPFGYTHTPMSVLQKYIGTNKELLINFMSSYVNRFVSRNAYGVANLFGIENLLHVAKLFCIDKSDLTTDDQVAEYVKYIIRSCNGKPAVQNCVTAFERVLRRKAGTDFSLTFEMRRKNNAVIYHMVFITNHVRGLETMKESMNRCTQFEGTLRMSDYYILSKGIELNFGNAQDNDRVADVIFEQFNGGERIHIKDIETYILMETPYVFRKTPLANMVKETPNPRITKVEDLSGNAPRIRGTFPDIITWFITFRA